jgi:ArsR family transcriptional regulator
LPELRRRLRKLLKNREIVAYCRGHYCVFAVEAAAILRRYAFKVCRLQDGFPQWRAAGLAVEVA